MFDNVTLPCLQDAGYPIAQQTTFGDTVISVAMNNLSETAERDGNCLKKYWHLRGHSDKCDVKSSPSAYGRLLFYCAHEYLSLNKIGL